jgi:DNA polymerase-3 subunit beta
VVVLPAKLVADVVRQLPEGTVQVSGMEEVSFAYGSSRLSMRSLEGEFPGPDGYERECGFWVSQEILGEIWKAVGHAVGRDETRPVFTGYLFELEGDALTVAATDTYKLALCKTDSIEEKVGNDMRIIVPRQVFKESVRLLSEKVYVSMGSGHITFTDGKVLITSRLIAGTYPDVNKVIPMEFTASCRVNRSELIAALRRVETVNHNAVLEVKRDGLSITSVSELGEAVERLVCESTGELKAWFFCSRLTDAVEAADSNEVEIKFTGPLSPAVVVPCGGGGSVRNVLQLVLPIKPPAGIQEAA